MAFVAKWGALSVDALLARVAATAATACLPGRATSVDLAGSVVAANVTLFAQELAISFYALKAKIAGRVAYVRNAYGVCLNVDSIDILVCDVESRRA